MVKQWGRKLSVREDVHLKAKWRPEWQSNETPGWERKVLHTAMCWWSNCTLGSKETLGHRFKSGFPVAHCLIIVCERERIGEEPAFVYHATWALYPVDAQSRGEPWGRAFSSILYSFASWLMMSVCLCVGKKKEKKKIDRFQTSEGKKIKNKSISQAANNNHYGDILEEHVRSKEAYHA